MGIVTRKGSGKNSAKQIEYMQRAKDAIALRLRGMSFDEIAREMGMKNKSVAHGLVARALDRIPKENVGRLRWMEAMRLDALQKPVYEKALTGDLEALKGMLSIMKRRAALFGLDAPKVETQVHVMLEKQFSIAMQKLEAAFDPETFSRILAALSEEDGGQAPPPALGSGNGSCAKSVVDVEPVPE